MAFYGKYICFCISKTVAPSYLFVFVYLTIKSQFCPQNNQCSIVLMSAVLLQMWLHRIKTYPCTILLYTCIYIYIYLHLVLQRNQFKKYWNLIVIKYAISDSKMSKLATKQGVDNIFIVKKKNIYLSVSTGYILFVSFSS
jgi:hypothetical protein